MMRARFEFKLADMWIGVFWQPGTDTWAEQRKDGVMMAERNRVDVWICFLPCVPLHIIWTGQPFYRDSLSWDHWEDYDASL